MSLSVSIVMLEITSEKTIGARPTYEYCDINHPWPQLRRQAFGAHSDPILSVV